ncbi:hypothetical protein FHU38_003224 [Saccharomonospora amisosensis]|uniref:Uncharacterized protein n=1 Tax=Saccharomonospora amisosensis TaxID=1128677 RepID=A0A7X5ZS05_9PSEU|nr:hypothetical protein [Saccharomonospora amisosensis]NIJ12880.1 hypothetical protein [Saccharomonospora amisosensis]
MNQWETAPVRPEDWRHDSVVAPGGLAERLAEAGGRAERELREGRPASAVETLDGLLAEVESWRRIAAEQANLDDDG